MTSLPAANDNDPDYPFRGTALPFKGFQKEALFEWPQDAHVVPADSTQHNQQWQR